MYDYIPHLDSIDTVRKNVSIYYAPVDPIFSTQRINIDLASERFDELIAITSATEIADFLRTLSLEYSEGVIATWEAEQAAKAVSLSTELNPGIAIPAVSVSEISAQRKKAKAAVIAEKSVNVVNI